MNAYRINVTKRSNRLRATIMAFVCNTEIAPKFRTFCVRGINVAAIDVAMATDLIEQLATDAHGVYVTVTGAHGIVESVYDEQSP